MSTSLMNATLCPLLRSLQETTALRKSGMVRRNRERCWAGQENIRANSERGCGFESYEGRRT
eukprot:618907-Hanusia_phi.AAC.2